MGYGPKNLMFNPMRHNQFQYHYSHALLREKMDEDGDNVNIQGKIADKYAKKGFDL